MRATNRFADDDVDDAKLIEILRSNFHICGGVDSLGAVTPEN